MKRKIFAMLSAGVLTAGMLTTPARAVTAASNAKQALPPSVFEALSEYLGTDDFVVSGLPDDFFTVSQREHLTFSFLSADDLGAIPVYYNQETSYADFFIYDDTTHRGLVMWSDLYFDIKSDTPFTAADFPELCAAYEPDVIQFYESRQSEQDGLYRTRVKFLNWETLIQDYWNAYQILTKDDRIQGIEWTVFHNKPCIPPAFSVYVPNGDVNDDGVINVCDAILLARQAANEKDLPLQSISENDNGDIDMDGVVTTEDVMLLIKKLAKK